MKELGLRIRAVRNRLGLTLQRFADDLGVSKSHLSGIENGKVNVSDLLLKSIARQSSTAEHWLRTGEGTMEVASQMPTPHSSDPELQTLQEALATWWAQADEDERAYLRVALRRAVPELRLDIKRREER